MSAVPLRTTYLDPHEIAHALEAMVACGLHDDLKRRLLIAVLDPVLAAGLPQQRAPRDQLWSDIATLARLRPPSPNDVPPLAEWLSAAARLAEGRPESAVFMRLAERVRGRCIEAAPFGAHPGPGDALDPRPPQVVVHHGAGIVYGTVNIHPPLATSGARLLPPTDATFERRPLPTAQPPSEQTPYPLLDPIRDRRCFGGRDDDIAAIVGLIRRRPGLMGLYGPSGYGKSSLLLAGLLPRLFDLGVPVALHRRPCSPGVGRALISGLIRQPEVPDLPDNDPTAFAAWIEALGEATGEPPVLVLDQFESIFKAGDVRLRARIGLLLAATVDVADHHPAACRWILAYREEFHGTVQRWLKDVLEGAPANARQRLPRDLSPDHSLSAVALAPLGGHGPAAEAFHDAITRPLQAYPRSGWRFVGDSARRLAAAFAEARRERPGAPLLPELQVVLNELVLRSRGRALEVDGDITQLIDDALRRHVLQVLDRTFVSHTRPAAARTMALLALRRLADAEGRRRQPGLPRSALQPLAGPAVLDVLAGWSARLLIPGIDDGEPVVMLSHDRLAEVIVGLDDSALTKLTPGFDGQLIELARLIGQRSAQFCDRADVATLALTRRERTQILAHAGQLLWDDDRRRWWTAAVEHRRRRWRRLTAAAVAAALVLGLVGERVLETRRRTRIAEAVDVVETSDSSEAIMTGLQALIDADASAALLDGLIDEAPISAAEGAPRLGVEQARERFIQRRLDPPPTTAGDFGHLIAGIDIASHPSTPGRISTTDRRRLREQVRIALRAQFPERRSVVNRRFVPVRWQRIAGGVFEMGDDTGEITSELPIHPVTISTFEISISEVTMDQYRRFDEIAVAARNRAQDGMEDVVSATRDDGARLPMWMITWYEAQAFALWSDPAGRLPTEAEWEYAARGGEDGVGQGQPYWSGSGNASLRNVGWHAANSNSRPHEVCRPPARYRRHPLGLCDVHGNLYEWTASRMTPHYGAAPQTDPQGPRRGALRVTRGGSFARSARHARLAHRDGRPPDLQSPMIGIRLARTPR